MDIDLLSRMVKELILDADEVSLPGIGSFVAEMVPSTFSDKGYTINPPYRRLYFRGRQEAGDNSLARLYAASNEVELSDAERIIGDFLAELKEVLQQKKTIVFPELGRLRATRENNFFFVPDEDLDIYPAGFGLEPVSLKNHEETPEEVSEALDGFKAIIDSSIPVEPEPVPAEPEPAAAEPAAQEPEPIIEEPEAAPAEPEVSDRQDYVAPESEAQEQPSPEGPAAQDSELPLERVEKLSQEPKEAPAKKKSSAGKVLLVILIVLVVLAALAFVAFMIAARVAPDWLDTLLYTPEQLEILHGNLPL
ncbi:MAG: hypothetical protein IKR15_06560 [Bacteroidales bacterium]|nr:hypothetical protein [Bacteroidales bacterium]